MPAYLYETESGEMVELFMSVKEMERRQRHDGSITLDDGRAARRNFGAEMRDFRNTPGCWPMYSDAAGCHPLQVRQMQEALAKKGVQCHFTPDGRAVLESRSHRRDVLKAMGLFDRSAGFGDPTPSGRSGDRR